MAQIKESPQALCFVGSPDYFRLLIKDFGRLAQPLTDVVKDLPMEKAGQASSHRRVFKHTLIPPHHWGEPQRAAFLQLKTALITEPVLRTRFTTARLFRITINGSSSATVAS